jgi:biopolymer transport protein TolQ
MNDWELLAVGFKRGAVVPALLWLMIACSVLSWAIIVRTWLSQRHERRGYRQVRLELDRADRADSWFASMSGAASNDAGASRILRAVVDQHGAIANVPVKSLEGIRVVIKTAVVHEIEHVQQTLPLLATISSVSPYLGLFGTVWGVMDAFGALGGLDQETAFAQVAPGIAQALVATGIGLAVAIPAAVAYNLFLARAGRLADSFDLIGEELLARISDSSLLQKG